jgi:hypothetical protein
MKVHQSSSLSFQRGRDAAVPIVEDRIPRPLPIIDYYSNAILQLAYTGLAKKYSIVLQYALLNVNHGARDSHHILRRVLVILCSTKATAQHLPHKSEILVLCL